MAGMKKPKKAKTPKRVKLPKRAIKNISERDARKIAKRLKKTDKKRDKKRDKKVNGALGVVAITLCMVSSALDIIIKKKNEK